MIQLRRSQGTCRIQCMSNCIRGQCHDVAYYSALDYDLARPCHMRAWAAFKMRLTHKPLVAEAVAIDAKRRVIHPGIA